MDESEMPFDADNFIPADYAELIRQSYAKQGGLVLPPIDQTALMINRALAVSVSDDLVKKYHDNKQVDDDFVNIFVRQTVDYAFILTNEVPNNWTPDNLFQAMGMTLGYLEVDRQYTGLLVELMEAIVENLVERGLIRDSFFTPDVRAWLMETVPEYLNDLEESIDEPLDDEEVELMQNLMTELGLEVTEDELRETNVDFAQDTTTDDDDLHVKFFFEVLNDSGIPALYKQHRSIQPVIKKHIAYLKEHQELLVLTVVYVAPMREWLETQIEMGDWADTQYAVRDFFDGLNGLFLQDVVTVSENDERIHYTAELQALITGILAHEPDELAYSGDDGDVPDYDDAIHDFMTDLVNRDELTPEGLETAQAIISMVLDEIAVKTHASLPAITPDKLGQVLRQKFQTFDLFGLDGFEFVDDIVIEFARWAAAQDLMPKANVLKWGKAIETVQFDRYAYALIVDAANKLEMVEIGQDMPAIY
ncbi:hypothetical protein [Weissella confusa]|uniref:hypothetical protein n=1 Tax=Weissella confusa TaxID=1583 RepID=UPI00024668DD|nr:hypothetical protein [Weissella confusa]MBJ7616037.1 hypothetical protein [Weissella confusa]MBJ7626051.1 hypothetical protein [Weissella confusa]MBJ7690498.1 hypothetical protein [Weissella confusa]MBJ7700744.1 hypothetical protein [Weissella confusa]CCF30190.1 Protein of unknown function [Weissella confusa LBAE C39-2]